MKTAFTVRAPSVPKRTVALLAAMSLAVALLGWPPHAAVAREGDRPRPGITRNAWDEDVAAKQVLDREGAVRVGRDVVLWFPKDSLTDAQASEIVARLDRGIRAAKRRIGKPDWAVEGDRRIHYYCPATYFISHAPGGNCAFIPLWRMREDQAPWLHESLHLLLATPKGDWLARRDSVALQRTPLWLMEGLADALAMQISEEEGIEYFSPLLGVPPDRLDSLAADALHNAPSDSVLAKIGTRGKLPQLFGPDRVKYAVPFYAGSASFTRYIARLHGFQPLLRAIADFDHETETLSRELGEPLDRVKSEWLASIGFSAQGRVDAALPPQRSMDDMHGDCAHFSWNMTREMDLWQGAAIEIRAGTASLHPPGVPLDQRVALTLAPHRQVRFVVPPGKAPGTDSTFSGLVVFTPPADGVYRVSAGHPVWIDAIVSGRSVASERFEMQTGCRTIFKSIAFAFHAGEPVVLQVSGSSLASVALLVTRWSD